MKRTSDSSRRASASNVAPTEPRAKRAKTLQACTSCRKNKTRCDRPDGSNDTPAFTLSCHRCRILSISCSFESSSTSHTSPKSAVELPGPSSPPQTRSASSSQSVASPPAPVSSSSSSSSYPFPATTRDSSGDSLSRQIKLEFKDPLSLVTTPRGTFKLSADWGVTPLLALHELSWKHAISDIPAANISVHTSLANVLSNDQVHYLVGLFDSRYGPWLNLAPSQEIDSPFLTIVRCAIASRHLDDPLRSRLAPSLLKLTEDAITKHTFSASPSIGSVQALLILSLWSHRIWIPPNDELRDGRLVAALAVSLATNLHLNDASSRVRKLQNYDEATELTAARDRARLWVSLCNAESMLCLGTGRSPLSQRSDGDLIAVCLSSHSTLSAGRDTRSELMGRFFDLAEKASRIHLAPDDDINEAYLAFYEILRTMEMYYRIAAPYPVVVEQEGFYFHMILLCYHACKLMALHHILREMHILVHRGQPARPRWFEEVKVNGVKFVALWGSDALKSAETILVSVLSCPEPHLLGTCPDVIFVMVSFAAVFIVTAKFAIRHIYDSFVDLPGVSDRLLAKVVDRLNEVAVAPDHAPARAARMIKAVVVIWEKKVGLDVGPNDGVPAGSNAGEQSSGDESPTLNRDHPPEGSTAAGAPIGDFNDTFTNADLDFVFDSDFFATSFTADSWTDQLCFPR